MEHEQKLQEKNLCNPGTFVIGRYDVRDNDLISFAIMWNLFFMSLYYELDYHKHSVSNRVAKHRFRLNRCFECIDVDDQ